MNTFESGQYNHRSNKHAVTFEDKDTLLADDNKYRIAPIMQHGVVSGFLGFKHVVSDDEIDELPEEEQLRTAIVFEDTIIARRELGDGAYAIAFHDHSGPHRVKRDLGGTLQGRWEIHPARK